MQSKKTEISDISLFHSEISDVPAGCLAIKFHGTINDPLPVLPGNVQKCLKLRCHDFFTLANWSPILPHPGMVRASRLPFWDVRC